MKKLLNFLVVTALTTSTGISVVACGKELVESGSQAEISTKILENLGLIDEEGKGLKEVVLKWNENEPYFDVDQESIKLTDLLVDQDQELAKAKDQVSFDFLRALNIELQEGTTFEDGLFEVEEVAAIKTITNDVQIETMKSKNNDQEILVIQSGTYKLQFFNVDGSKALSKKSQIEVKIGTDALFGVFAENEPNYINLGYEEFVYRGSPIQEFRLSNSKFTILDWVNEEKITHIMSENETEIAQKFNQFQKLIGWNITFKVIDYSFISGENPLLESGDSLTLSVNLTKDDQVISLFETVSKVTIFIP